VQRIRSGSTEDFSPAWPRFDLSPPMKTTLAPFWSFSEIFAGELVNGDAV